MKLSYQGIRQFGLNWSIRVWISLCFVSESITNYYYQNNREIFKYLWTEASHFRRGKMCLGHFSVKDFIKMFLIVVKNSLKLHIRPLMCQKYSNLTCNCIQKNLMWRKANCVRCDSRKIMYHRSVSFDLSQCYIWGKI